MLTRIKNLFAQNNKRVQDVVALGGLYILIWVYIKAANIFFSHDAYNNFSMFFHTVINEILVTGQIPLWDPFAGCGWPIYLAFPLMGVLDPVFLPIAYLSRMLKGDLIQTYQVLAYVRIMIFLGGLYFLNKMYLSSSVLVFIATLAVGFVIVPCYYRDHIVYITYIPFLLHSIFKFQEQVDRSKKVDHKSLVAIVVLFCVSAQIYNPSYVVILLLSLVFGCVIVDNKNIPTKIKQVASVLKLKHYCFYVLLALLLVSPSLVILTDKAEGNYFSLLRRQQAGPTQSLLLKENIEYMSVNFESSPSRPAQEIGSVFFPQFYNGPNRMEGPIYFGFLALMGLLAGFAVPNKAFYRVALAASVIFFVMTPLTSSVLKTWGVVFPVINLINQRHLLYPLFILLSSIAGVIGLNSLLKEDMVFNFTVKFKIALLAFLAPVFCMFLYFQEIAKYFFNQGFFTLALIYLFSVFLFLFAIRKIKEQVICANAACYGYIILVLVSVLDGHAVFSALTKAHHKNTGIFQKSLNLRQPQPLSYTPFRSIIPPTMYGSPVTSASHVYRFPSAFPAYPHADLVFATYFYNYTLGMIPEPAIAQIFGINYPMFRLVNNYEDLSFSSPALYNIKASTHSDYSDFAFVQTNPKMQNENLDTLLASLPLAPPRQHRYQQLMHPWAGDTERVRMYNVITLNNDLSNPQVMTPISPSLYHKKIYRYNGLVNTALKAEIADLSNVSFEGYNVLGDIDGEVVYTNNNPNSYGGPGGDPSTQRLLMISDQSSLLYEIPYAENLAATDFPKHIFVNQKRKLFPSSLAVKSLSCNQVDMEVNETKDKLLLFGYAFDKQWQCLIDGQDVPVLLTNFCFSSVKVPPGVHKITFVYKATLFMVSFALQFLIILSICFFMAYSVRKNNIQALAEG